MATCTVSILLPVYNEASTIREVLRRIVRAPYSKEIILVDDGSSDGSTEILKHLDEFELSKEKHENPFQLKVLFHEKNMGKGAAIRTALGTVTGDVVVIQDADLEYNPLDYPRLVQPIVDNEADVVYGSRFLGSPRRVLYFWHTVGNKMLTLFSNMFSNLNLTDMETGYKAFRSDVLKRLSLKSNRFQFEIELTAKIAREGLRIYEVPVSYAGRTYSEGKKITWKDGLAALWAISRFNLIDDGPSEDRTLRRLSHLSRYNRWVWSLTAPFVGQNVLEVGAGIGNMTQYLISKKLVVATDIAPQFLARLKTRFAGRPNVVVQYLGLKQPLIEQLNGRRVDTVLCLNVLEHIEQDQAVLESVFRILPAGGRLVLVVPALKRLFGEIDKQVGHYRRYERSEIKDKLQRAGFEVEEERCFNAIGIPGWYLNSCLLQRTSVPGLQARLNDLLIPLLKLESLFHLPWGMSLVALGRKNGTPLEVGQRPRQIQVVPRQDVLPIAPSMVKL
jgi:glycosyltransferase involved in cell wall biosynthesis/phospholipid N-methyltransferase